MTDIIYTELKPLAWSDIEISETVYPSNKIASLGWIKYMLGYLPREHIYFPQLGFLQALIENKNTGAIKKEVFYDELEYHCKQVRNRDMKEGGWLENKIPDEDDYKLYNESLEHHKYAARKRLSEALCYEPAIEYSLYAEVYLRQLFEQKEFYTNMPYGPIDSKAVTVVRYREAYFLENESIADDSELIGLRLELIKARKANS